MAEIDKINYTLYWLVILCIVIGHSTMFIWPTADRELFVELADMAYGNRITHSWLVPDKVRNDLREGFVDKVLNFLDYFKKSDFQNMIRYFFITHYFVREAKELPFSESKTP